MSADLHDIRTKVPQETLSVIQALEMASGDSMSEIVRGWIVERAAIELHKATIVCRVMGGKGTDRAGECKL